MEQKKRSFGIMDVLLLVISAAFLLGITTVFRPCGPAEDGSWMTCHWAGQAVMGVAAVLTVIALIRLFVSDLRIKMGLDLAMIPTAVLSALLPKQLIHLCMMETMRCHSVMRPAAIQCSVLIIIAAAVDLILCRRKLS